MSARIFISYSRHDSTFAREVESVLNNRGFSVWLDTDQLHLGEFWREEIVQAIEECHYFLLLLSPHSIRSTNVVRELSLAESSSRSILPVMLEEVVIPDTMKYQLAGLQFVVLNASLGHQGFQNLLDALPDPQAAQPAGPPADNATDHSLRGEAEAQRSSQGLPPAEAGARWDKTILLSHLTLAIGPMASLLVDPLPDPLHNSDVQTLRTLFQQQGINLDLLDRSLTPSQRQRNLGENDTDPPSQANEEAIGEWLRLQVGPIAEMIYTDELRREMRYDPSRARGRLEKLGVASSVIDQLLHRCSSVQSTHRSE